jgi:hypothetical protein
LGKAVKRMATKATKRALNLSGFGAAQGHLKQALGNNEVALAAALPVCCPPVRVPGQYRDAPSATASLYEVTDVSFETPTFAEPLVPHGQYFAAVSKDPLHCKATYSAKPFASANWAYAMVATPDYGAIGSRDYVAGTASTRYVYNVPSGVQSYNVVPEYAVPTPASTWDPHGDVLFPFFESGHGGYYVNSDPTGITAFRIRREGGGTLTETSTSFTLHQFSGSEWEAVATVSAAGFNAGSDVTLFVPFPATSGVNGALYRLTVEKSIATDGNYSFSVRFSGICDTIGFSPLPGLTDHASHIESFRVTSASIMFTPTVPELHEAGTLVGVQLPPYVPVDQFLDYAAVTELPQMRQKDIKNGIYGFHKPGCDEELEFEHPFPGAGPAAIANGLFAGRNSTRSAWYSKSGWIVVFAKVPLDGTSYPSGNGYLTTNYGCEYTTTSQWPQQLYPRLDFEQYTAMLRELKDVQQWHENAFHIRDIKNALGNAGKFALELAPTLMALLERFGPPQYRPLAGIGREAAMGLQQFL